MLLPFVGALSDDKIHRYYFLVVLLVSIDYAHEKLAGLTALLCRIVGGYRELWCDVN